MKNLGNYLSWKNLFEVLWLLKWPLYGLIIIIEPGFTFFIGFVLPFILLEFVFCFGMIIWALIKLNRKRAIKHLVRLFAILIFIPAFIYCEKIMQQQEEQSMILGDKIIGMIEEYKLETGKYPVDYNSLPSAAKSIKPANGREFSYYYDSKEDKYDLSFGTDVFLVSCDKGSGDKDWKCDD